MLDDLEASMARIIEQGLVETTLDQCSNWASNKIGLPEPFPGSFEKSVKFFPWEKEILNCDSPRLTVRKAAQLGFSVAAIIKTLYTVERKKIDTLYVLPTQIVAGDFSQARLAAILNASPSLVNLFSKTNKVGLKTTGDFTSLYIRGSMSEAGLVSLPVGQITVDEWDRCARNTMSLVLERTASFENAQLFGLSTPTLPDFGITKQYELGTQEHFHFRCPSCSKFIELLWPDCVEICGDCTTSPDVLKSYYKCSQCGAKLPDANKFEKSEWLASGIWVPSQTAYGHRSFHINQMYAPNRRPSDLVIAYFRGMNDEAAATEWHNQKMGEPYLIEGARVTEKMIEDAQARGGHRKTDDRPRDASKMIVMGVDTGSFLDVVISEFLYTSDPGNEPHLNSIERVLFEGRFAGSDWGVLDHLMAEWQVHHCCIDFQPETNKAKEFARRFPKCVSLVQYREGTVGDEIKPKEDDNRVETLTIDRTVFFDMALGRFHKERIELPGDLSGTFREHIQSPCRTYELDNMGNPKATYISLDADHLAHALLYAEVAHFQAYNRTTGRSIKVGESYYNM